MARIRQIKPEFFKSEDVAGLEWPARMLFIGLWTIAAADGRLTDRPRRIAAELFPYDPAMADQVDLFLGMLAARELIVRYVAGGKPCIQIVNFSKHQKPHTKEPGSGLPPPPAQAQTATQVVDSKDVGQSPVSVGQAQVKPGENLTSRSGSLGSGSLGSGGLPPGPITGKAGPLDQKPERRPGDTPSQTSLGILSAFGSRWERVNRKPFFKAPFDDRAAHDLAESINSIPDPEERENAWAEIGPAIDRFLRISKPFYAGHPFAAFAKDISALRTDDPAVRAGPSAPFYRELPRIAPGVPPPPRPRP